MQISPLPTLAGVSSNYRMQATPGGPRAALIEGEASPAIDESGEDYLYPQSFFAPIELPQTVRRAVLAAA